MEWDQKGSWVRFCNHSGYSMDFGFWVHQGLTKREWQAGDFILKDFYFVKNRHGRAWALRQVQPFGRPGVMSLLWSTRLIWWHAYGSRMQGTMHTSVASPWSEHDLSAKNTQAGKQSQQMQLRSVSSGPALWPKATNGWGCGQVSPSSSVLYFYLCSFPIFFTVCFC